MGDELAGISGPEQTYDDFGNLPGEFVAPVSQVHDDGFRLWDAGNYETEYNRQVRGVTHANNYYSNEQPHRHVANINIIMPDRHQIDRPGPEYDGDEEHVGGRRARQFVRLFKKDPEGTEKTNRDQRDAWRAAKKTLRAEIKSTREKRHTYFKQRAIRRGNFEIKDRTDDTAQQILDVKGDGKMWEHRLDKLAGGDKVLLAGTEPWGYGWSRLGAPLSSISFSMAGVLPVDKPFMDRTAYYRVNHTLMQHTDEEITQQKLDAMSFFEEHYGLEFKSHGKPIQGEEDDDSLEIPGLATLRHYAISPSLKTRITTAVSANHPIEANEEVHEAGWIATVIARRGANLGGIFGGDKGKAVKPGTSMSYGYWVFMNPKFQEDHAIIHFESSEPSFFGGASGHVAHHYVIHDLSVIDGIQIKKGAWGTATSMTTERKILGNKKKLGDLYGKTEAHVQTTINVTHF